MSPSFTTEKKGEKNLFLCTLAPRSSPDNKEKPIVRARLSCKLFPQRKANEFKAKIRGDKLATTCEASPSAGFPGNPRHLRPSLGLGRDRRIEEGQKEVCSCLSLLSKASSSEVSGWHVHPHTGFGSAE